MGERRSATGARAWDQLDLLVDEDANQSHSQGVGARQAHQLGAAGGGGYLNECTTPKLRKGRPKNFANLAAQNPREAAMLAELEAMGISRVMLQVAYAIGFDNFMAMWLILDNSYEAMADNDSGIYLRLQRLSAYRRYQRNRFIETMASMGHTQQEIARSVKRDLGEDVSDRHLFRLIAGGRVKT